MSRHVYQVALEVDDDALEAYRKQLEDAGELEAFAGPPEEWRSMLDLSDMAERRVVVRTEIIDHYEEAGP